MNNSVIKWLLLPITITLIIVSLIGISMLSNQSEQIKDKATQISSLEQQLTEVNQQLSAIQGEISSLASLYDRISELETVIDNLGEQVTTKPVLENIADVVKNVRAGVVAINTTKVYKYGWGSFTYDYVVTGAGSGWIFNDNGIIVTNYHVIEGMDTIKVTLDSGTVYDVDLTTIRYNKSADIAIFKIDAESLKALKIGNASKLAVGEWVVAMGNSLDMGVSAKEGIIGQLHVSIDVDGQPLEELIETSAAINSGNSGGVLVNMSGEVIGITNAKISAIGVEGMGYAINIDYALSVINELLQA
jgi:S1-C subfamily serine protease